MYAAVLWDASHTQGRLCKGGIGQGKETENLNAVDVLGATIGSRLRRSKEDWKR
jgi:hypothetical protein